MAKVEAARSYGAQVELAGEGFDEAAGIARARAEETGATFVHAFEDGRVVAGQGTLSLELAEQLPDGPATVVIPVGGGGLASGIAIALDELRPEVRLVGVQAAGCAVWSPLHRNAKPNDVKAAQALGLKVIPWTVNERADMERLIALGVDGLITDYPDRLRAAMAEKNLALPPQVKAQ